MSLLSAILNDLEEPEVKVAKSIRFNASDAVLIDEIADRINVSASDVVRYCVQAGIEELAYDLKINKEDLM